jgi:hypothetical protein
MTESGTVRQELQEAVDSVLWWPSAMALLVLAVAYALVSSHLTVGPPGLVLVIVVVALAIVYILRWRRLHFARRIVALVMLTIVSLSIGASAIFFLVTPTPGGQPPVELLRDALLLWVSNTLSFALWYWEVDGGGPAHRMLPGAPPSTDFAFPQQQQAALAGQSEIDWAPLFLDYLFLAFTSSTTFGPTDTLVMARHAKALMMLQASVSLIIFGGVVARAVGNLH